MKILYFTQPTQTSFVLTRTKMYKGENILQTLVLNVIQSISSRIWPTNSLELIFKFRRLIDKNECFKCYILDSRNISDIAFIFLDFCTSNLYKSTVLSLVSIFLLHFFCHAFVSLSHLSLLLSPSHLYLSLTLSQSLPLFHSLSLSLSISL